MLLAAVRTASAADENATLLRVFLLDGTSLVSYGEPARVGDRVVFSMPTGALPNPPLHLVNLPTSRVDWAKTDRYAAAARAAHYLSGQAEQDYAALSGRLAQTLNDVAATTDPAQRLAIVERARRALADWPQSHYNYRRDEVRGMVAMLDEAIADLRAAQGASRFDIALEAFSEAPAIVEPLLPPPTLRESIEQTLNAALAVDNPVERTSLLSSALASIDSGKDELSPDWVLATRTSIQAKIRAEVRVDRSYRRLTTGMLGLAETRARMGDVRGVQRLIAAIHRRDSELGGRRPDAVAALVAAVEEKLDATRRLRLARDRWELRLPVLREYGVAIREPFALFTALKPALEDIKSLAGSSPASLAMLERSTARLTKLMAAIAAPEELTAAHAQMVSAVQLASNAAAARREATLANDMDRAWNASSAAAGALMLGTRARADILELLRPPRLR